MSTTENTTSDPGIASEKQAEEFLAKRVEAEAYYKKMADAFRYEHEYTKMMTELTEFELRTKMATIKLVQLDAQMKAQKEEAEKAPERKLKTTPEV